MSALDRFADPAAHWFRGAFEAPTDVQERGWESVAAGHHTLMCAPTGSGKTLAAFLWCLDRLGAEPTPAAGQRCRVLYVSPLKALTVDIERNLRAPLRGMAMEAERLDLDLPPISVGVRTGDTPQRERREMLRTPPDVLITTPESLFLILTSSARETLRTVRWVIVDEIHSMAGNKRGAHLALSLERLAALTAIDPQRIGLSATQRPLEEVAHFLGGTGRPVEIVDAGSLRSLDLSVEVPVDDMANLERGAEEYAGPAAAIGADSVGPRRSIWPAIHPRILELVRAHRSTIIFVNSRRMSERLAARLNELAGEELVRAHHGSIAREQRMEIEDALKAGRLPAIVATSSLELGIDMGAVDLVIQVETPDSVASGIQRVGRAGHSVGERSKGVVFPKHRGDLLESAVVVERMLTGEIESTRVPRNPLDVLAQQVVAMCALDEWEVDHLAALVRRAYPFSDLGRRAFEATLDMLAGRYPSDDFGELRPRIVWDRVAGTVRGRAGAQRLAVTSGGTIPDRGLFTVNLFDGGGGSGGGAGATGAAPEKGFAAAGLAAPPGGRRPGRRVGELDEEMVYEMRVGQVFLLGATSWKVVDITPSEVLVLPAPGEPGTIAFWHGDAIGRPVEVGRALGRLTRELAAAPAEQARTRLLERAGFDQRAATNLLGYLDDQAAATGQLPDDRTIVVERFRDQLGDWRVCVLTPFGARLHAPWALAAAANLEARLGMEVQVIHTDDGFAVRLPEADAPPSTDDLFLDPDAVMESVTEQLRGSSLFASRFRENAARALLLPRRRPDQRTPLWQQRQRSHDLLQVASAFPDFPVVLETYRECLVDVFDLDALADLMRQVRTREVRVIEVQTERASPFASSLLFDYIAQYMYEGDSPIGERRAAALTLDRELLAELLGSEELRELLDPEVMEALELELQGLLPDRFPRDLDEAADCLRRLGDMAAAEAAARGVSTAWLTELERDRRALPVRVAGEPRWIAVEDAGRYREALGVTLPPGLPDAFLEGGDAPLDRLVTRFARTNVPFLADDLAQRWGLSTDRLSLVLARLTASGALVSGEFRPGGSEPEFCHPEVLRLLRRKSLAALRREIEPVAREVLGRFLPGWHGVGSDARGPDRLLEVVRQLQGLPLPVSVLEQDVISCRVKGYSPQLLDQLFASGELVWAGRGALGPSDGRVALYLRSDAAALLTPTADLAPGEVEAGLREHLRRRGASFFRDLLFASPGLAQDEVMAALWRMAWAGEVTNDTFLPLRTLGLRRGGGGGSRRRPLMRVGPPGSEGRWSLLADVTDPAVTGTERLAALAGVLLQRHGVVTREAAVGEGSPGGFAAVYPVLRAMEEAGRVRRGYFVDGMGGSQFALPGAVDRLRASRDDHEVVALAATDPANPYGVSMPWPAFEGRLARVAGAYAVLEGGELRAYLERGGRGLAVAGELVPAHIKALVGLAGRRDRLEIRTVNGAALSADHERVLREAGFAPSPRGMVLWPERPLRLDRGSHA